ncbi:NIPSNAP family containing protein [Bosea sp. 62]|uniref:NIPSNAP family protein n=1 Tax=unclassified Bosea (in: a-proteobacteria) TaxID=2653178 RepID=UPI00125A247C|nr:MULTISPECIES: NIPSNAP family protein [unclassified Bosea (in: a-proteobacteria)]CAD5253119.1 NIPSNAP family containing protein [Bosea sp. 7B]CAD5278205.1 NIPSNAP family containing protein [Bosea sp. 21B]CAD5279258.1 NIPSNAP family containing protein [Bosea sp. 46]VVT59682.1 NIPSNAP family containing protein [Bosea sp. EC-HK365B]VXB39140.1 NIPSNAP family containing protein [Bosea sp. 62]
MRYEIATLTVRLGKAGAVVAAIDAALKAPEAKGRLLGCWASEIGTLNQVILLRGFTDEAELLSERQRLLASGNPFGAGEDIAKLAFDSYAPFPFLPPVQPGKLGAVYEIRTYMLKHGGVPATIAAWQAAVPARVELSPLVIAMYALDGPPRFTHIWPFSSLDQRAAVRADSVAKGIWPPKGGPEWLTGEMYSTIALPTAISPPA